MEPPFSSAEKRVIDCLEAFFVQHGNPTARGSQRLFRKDIIAQCGLTEEEYRRIINRCEAAGLVEVCGPGYDAEFVQIDPSISAVKHQSDTHIDKPRETATPPPPNKVEGAKAWAFSKWWIVPIVGLIAALLLMRQIIEALQVILKWFGVIN